MLYTVLAVTVVANQPVLCRKDNQLPDAEVDILCASDTTCHVAHAHVTGIKPDVLPQHCCVNDSVRQTLALIAYRPRQPLLP